MVPMPAVVILIVCKVAVAGPPDQNSQYTHAENLQWHTEFSKMVCRRQEVQVVDMSAELGADPQPFDQNKCQRSAMLLGPQWDAQHKGSKYRFWRVACPTPIMDDQGTPDTRDDVVVGYSLPDCGHREYVICERDSFI